MSLQAPPQHFTLDHKNRLTYELHACEGIGRKVGKIEESVRGYRIGDAIGRAADIHIAQANPMQIEYCRGALFVGSLVAYGSFLESDAPAPIRDAIQRRLAVKGPEPSVFRCETLTAAANLIIRAGGSGHRMHPELDDATRVLREYYTESQGPDFGLIADGGIGVMINKLDTAWRETRNEIIDSICSSEGAQAAYLEPQHFNPPSVG